MNGKKIRLDNICPKCEKYPRYSDQSYCKECCRKRSLAYYRANRETIAVKRAARRRKEKD